MKRLLAASLLMLCGAAQAQQADVCRVKIGQDWIPMGASALQSCLQYAAAAASPGERQLADFGGQSFAYEDGHYFQSSDGGHNWQPFDPRDGGGQITALNVLRKGPPAEQKPAKPEPKRVKKKTAPVVAVAKPDAIIEDQVSAESPTTLTATESAALATEAAIAEQASSPAAAAAIAAGSENALANRSPRVPPAVIATPVRDCQINSGGGWQSVAASSLKACGELLVRRMSNSRGPVGRAYWGNQFLAYHGNTLYQSPDGRNWIVSE